MLICPRESEILLNLSKTVVTLISGTAAEFIFVPIRVTAVPPLNTQFRLKYLMVDTN